jgi:hypothetical protein
MGATFLQFQPEDFQMNIKVGDTVELIDLRKNMRIDDKILAREYMEQASWFAWYSALLADQEDRLARMKTDAIRHKTDISLRIRRGELKIGLEGKLTEGAINDYLESDKVARLKQDEIEVQQATCKKLEVLVKASMQRKDMLVQLGLAYREELKHLPHVTGDFKSQA